MLFLIIYIYLILNQNTPPLGVPLSVVQSSVHSEVSNTPTNIMLEDQSSDDEDIDHSLTGDHSSSVNVMPVELQMLEAHSHVISKQKGITSHFLLV